MALGSGVPSLILFAAYGSVLHRQVGFVSNEHGDARFVDAPVAIDHKNAVRRIGSSLNLGASRLFTSQDFLNLHGARISRTTIRVLDWG